MGKNSHGPFDIENGVQVISRDVVIKILLGAY